ncbi:uncharacterized protein LOC110155454 [Boleophthalmus pectinirostris]|uniref:uncharacterized protein LOC110155454 n=1 Tax=Boleophthalmus pectinirostris TaxID=150288 RepID=UPI00242DE1E5|nr:uncharacterized protein LOC110155454 [Boleophthalmus pectinirostris]
MGKQQQHDIFWQLELFFKTHFLQQLAVLVLCHGWAVAGDEARYFLVQGPMSWNQSREFCLRHFVDLAVMNTEREYWHLYNQTDGKEESFWIGLLRINDKNWTWVDGESLLYKQWWSNNIGFCVSLEAKLTTHKKMCSRYCNEPHAFVCQGPLMVGPQNVSWVSHLHSVSLSWNVSAFMQRRIHSYTVTTCFNTCSTSTYHYTGTNDTFTVYISNLTSATNYSFNITASVIRPDNQTGSIRTLLSDSTTLHIHTKNDMRHIIYKWIKVLFLAPTLWVLYYVLCKKGELKEFEQDKSLMETPTEETTVNMFSLKTCRVG